MKAIAIIAHGSRNPKANSEFQQQAEAIAAKLGNQYAIHEACFLELAEPSLADACAALVNNGATQIDVYPLFFNQGRHVSTDIPALVTEAKNRVPEAQVSLLPYFGSADNFADAVSHHISMQQQ